MKILLASKSPRRAALLQQIGIDYELVDIDIDEHIHDNETPEQAVARLAREKAQAGRAVRADFPLLAADTIVVIDEHILGKPIDEDDALRMLSHLSDRTHQVMTAIALIDTHGQLHEALSISEVTFRALTDIEMRNYWQTQEPQDKAGAYAVQGYGAVFIKNIAGSYSGIMGLPLYELTLLLHPIN